MAHILVIEDDRAIALGVRLNLRKEGHEVRIAQDGESGLQMAMEPDVDLIVLDVMLPERNGYDVPKELRRRGSTPSAPLLTPTGMEGDKTVALNPAPADCPPNPWRLDE